LTAVAATRPCAGAEIAAPVAIGRHAHATAVNDGEAGRIDVAAEHAHLKQRKEPDDEAVQTLGAGDDLKDQDFAEVRGIFAEKAGAGLAGKAAALGRTGAAETAREGRPQETDGESAEALKECSDHCFTPP